MNKKILFLDVDGTLMDFDGNPPESAREAVFAAKAAGHRLVICTGRLKVQIYPRVQKVMVSDMQVVEDIRSFEDVEKGAYYDSGRSVGEIQKALGAYFKVEGSGYEK